MSFLAVHTKLVRLLKEAGYGFRTVDVLALANIPYLVDVWAYVALVNATHEDEAVVSGHFDNTPVEDLPHKHFRLQPLKIHTGGVPPMDATRRFGELMGLPHDYIQVRPRKRRR